MYAYVSHHPLSKWCVCCVITNLSMYTTVFTSSSLSKERHYWRWVVWDNWDGTICMPTECIALDTRSSLPACRFSTCICHQWRSPVGSIQTLNLAQTWDMKRPLCFILRSKTFKSVTCRAETNICSVIGSLVIQSVKCSPFKIISASFNRCSVMKRL